MLLTEKVVFQESGIMSDSSSKESKIDRIASDLDKGLQSLRKQLIAQVKENPDFYGGAILDVNLRAGVVVSVKNSVEVVQKV